MFPLLNRFLPLVNTVVNAKHLLSPIRTASKKAGGSVKNGRDSVGKRLGVKKFGGEFVIPGNIIIRQRGKKYHGGENVGLGRDHTIFAKASGWVHFTFDRTKKRNFVHVLNTNPHFSNMQRMAALAKDPEMALKRAQEMATC